MANRFFKKRRPESFETAENGMQGSEAGIYPFVIERRLKGYRTMVIAFVAVSIALLIVTRSLFVAAFGAILAILTFLLYYMQKRQIETSGYEMWDFHIVEYTHLTRLNRKPTGFYAEALTGPYAGKMCHISLSSQAVIPPLDQKIELCVPSDLVANPIRDVFYIPQYYGIVFSVSNEG